MLFFRWYEENLQRDAEYQEYLLIQEIIRGLKKKPYLLEFVKEAIKTA